jgi:hypothetical protein
LSAPRRPGALLLALALAAAIPFTQQRIDARVGPFRAQEEVLYLWSGRQVKRLAPGFEGLMADLYWLRTVQYFGGTRLFTQDRRFELLEPLIDIAVTLDPRLEIAYQYGAIFLAEPAPVGAGRVDNALALLERGARENPQNWRLRKELAYFHFLFKGDARTAARVLLEAAELPGAAYWLRTMAADFLGRGGDRATARKVWQRMYDDSQPGAIRANALTHLRILDALDMRDRLQQAVEEFTREAGRRPASLQEVASRGRARLETRDPSGTPFEYDAKAGTVQVSRQSILWRAES